MDALQYAEQVFFATPARDPAAEARVQELEAKLQSARDELAGVKQDLAEKLDQLCHLTSNQSQNAFEQSKLEGQVHELVTSTQMLEDRLAVRDKELEDLRRVHAAQKKALRELQEAAAERQVSQYQEEEVSRSAAQLVVEEELERLSRDLSTLQTRSQLELAAKDNELRALRQQLQHALQQREDAVEATEQELTELMEHEVERARAESAARVSELQEEVVRLRTRLEDNERAEQRLDLPREMAALNNQKVQIQREFEAFRELTTHASRQSRDETARLLDENAGLRSKIASLTLEHIQARSVAAGAASGSHGGVGVKGRTFLPHTNLLPDFLLELDKQRQGLAPMGLIAIVVCLVILLAIIRAAVSVHGAHPVLCFLSKLGIQIGTGCGDVLEEAKEQLEKIIEKPMRVHDVLSEPEKLVKAGRSLLQLLHRARGMRGA